MKYISKSKDVKPTLTPTIIHSIAKYFAGIKKAYAESYINPRTLESMSRLCLASARLRMSPITEEVDFTIASELMDIYLRQFNYDLDAISGITNSVREAIRYIKDLISMHKALRESDIILNAEKAGFDKRKTAKAIDEMYKRGEIYLRDNDLYGVV